MTQPNVLFLLADDMGWGDVGYHGSYIDTPNIDRMAGLGLELDRHYVCPICTPTRVSLLTGRFPARFGRRATWPSNEPVLPEGYPTIASMFRNAGYATGLFGKWHLGSSPEFGPQHFGFDHSYGPLAGGIDPYSHLYKEGPFSRTWHRNGEFVEERGHVTDLLADEAARWIEDRSEPWFCYVPFTAVHCPVIAPEPWVDRYAGKVNESDPLRARSLEVYGAYASHMDHCIGRIIEAVKRCNALHDTIVIFASDNGASQGNPASDVNKYPDYHEPLLGLGSNGTLRGWKGTTYEGGIRTPAVLYWQGHIPHGKCVEPFCVADWMPTFADMLGAEADPRWDGRSVWPMLNGGGDAPAREIHWNLLHREFAVLRDDWKLIYQTENTPTCDLFNLAEDPYERRNLAGERPELVAELRDCIERNHKLDNVDERALSPDQPTQSADGDP
jgi:arylsulfatase A-like enzyme